MRVFQHSPGGRWARKNILFVGIDWKRKGGPDLVDAFRSVLRVHPDAHLTIVGCRPKIDLPNCNVVGEIPVRQLGKYYKEASVFCLPTHLDTAAIVLLEAMSYKLAVVSTAVGTRSEFVLEGETGRLVRPGDVAGLSQVLIDLVGDPDTCRTMGERGYERVMENFTWEKAGARLKDHIVSALR